MAVLLCSRPALGETELRITRAAVLLLAMLIHGDGYAGQAIVNASLNRETTSLSLLRGIFSMRVRVWPDGTPVRVFVLDDDNQVHVDFCKSVLRMYPYQLRQSWDRLVYSGTGQPPLRVASLAEMRARIASTQGAIGYLPNDPSGNEDESIKALHVQ